MLLGGPLWIFMYVGVLFFWPLIYLLVYMLTKIAITETDSTNDEMNRIRYVIVFLTIYILVLFRNLLVLV